jgi:acyl-CoA dehydrogenase
MEGIQEKYVKMVYQTLVIQASVSYISHILDKKITPSVLTAIMKQQTTERAREVIQLGMDIYAGSGICIGENNFFTKFYNSCPIGITVEGSNTLTRSLIIFGQGINKSHPHIYNLFQSIQEDDVKRFNIHFKEMFIDTIQIYFQSIFHFGHDSRLDKLTMKFANLSNFVALLGGGIKSKQMISGNMADILSNIFLSYAVIWYFHHHYDRQENARIMMNFLVDNLCQEAEIKLNTLIKNYPNKLLSTVLIPTRTKLKETDFRKMKEVFEIIQNDPQFIHDIKKDLFYEDTVIERLEKLSMINKKQNPKDYNELYQKIIQVGEFEI